VHSPDREQFTRHPSISPPGLQDGVNLLLVAVAALKKFNAENGD